MEIDAHSGAWYDRLAQMQQGYFYPWRSTMPPFNGEDTYLDMVKQHLSPDKDVLDCGCGHGEVPLEIAPLCRSVTGYDRTAAYIDLAQKAAKEQNIRNVTFVHANASAKYNNGQVRIPAEADAFDLLISRRGPTHWIEDARRVARPGAVLIQLNPAGNPVPPWNDQLPEDLQFNPPEADAMRSTIERRLKVGSLNLHSCWNFDVPEYLNSAEDLYTFLTWGKASDEVPSCEETRTALEQVFDRHKVSQGLELRFTHFLWKAIAD